MSKGEEMCGGEATEEGGEIVGIEGGEVWALEMGEHLAEIVGILAGEETTYKHVKNWPFPC